MFRIAMKAPTMAANIESHTVKLARVGSAAAICWELATRREATAGFEITSADMVSPLRIGRGNPRDRNDLRGSVPVQRFDGRDHRHARAQLDRRVAVERNLHGDALNHFREIAGGIV